MLKYTINSFREYIFIFLTATLIFLFLTQNCFSEEDIFTIKNIKIEEKIEVNFSRNKYINTAFKKAFQELIPKILLSKDLKKLNDTKIKDIKYLISNFQIIEEKYNRIVVWQNRGVTDINLDSIAGKSKTISNNDPLIKVAQGLGIYVGDII